MYMYIYMYMYMYILACYIHVDENSEKIETIILMLRSGKRIPSKIQPVNYFTFL